MPLDPELKAAIEAAVAAAVAPVIQAANESVAGLKKKNAELLSDKRALKEAERKRLADANTAQALRVADKFLARDGNPSVPQGIIRATDTELLVNRSSLHDPAEYRRLRGVAEEIGKRLRIVDDLSTDVNKSVVPVVHRFEHKGTTYLSAAAIEEMGGPHEYARLKEKNPGQKFHAFRDLNGVSAEVRAAHDAAMEPGDD